tara:strand:- start:288 stop:1439 length:1152 start_codon:yes stop_codon:yes gene_type:complete
MARNPLLYGCCFLLVGISLFSCKKNETPTEYDPVESEVRLPELPNTLFGYSGLSFPDSWLNDSALQLFGSSGTNIEISDAGATLGRVLFYDPMLSADGMVSCSSCHLQAHGFGDNSARSIGLTGEPSLRNAMPLSNMRYQRRLFWDARTVGLENQVLEPIEHPDEMGMLLSDLPEQLAALPYYGGLFYNAFGDSVITNDRVATALGQFIRCIRVHSSRYDEGLQTDFANFTDMELEGRALFFNGVTRCNQCHSGLNFFSNQAFINGLEVDYAASGDAGIGALTGAADDDGRFRTVSLRNVGMTAPYMHDGRFETLRDVVDFYSDSIAWHPYLDERLTVTGVDGDGQEPYQLAMTSSERESLVDFLLTLNDTVIQDAWWLSDPF